MNTEWCSGGETSGHQDLKAFTLQAETTDAGRVLQLFATSSQYPDPKGKSPGPGFSPLFPQCPCVTPGSARRSWYKEKVQVNIYVSM